MQDLTVADVMTTDVFAFAPDTSIETAARLLTSKHISGAPVIAEGGGRPLGVVGLSDLVDPDRVIGSHEGYPLFYRIENGESFELGDNVKVQSGRVSDVMSPFVLSIESIASLAEAANRMLGESVHRLLVMDGNELVGIVTTTDLLRGFVRALHQATDQRVG